MAWNAIYETATGRLVSVSQIVADPLPAGLTAVVLAGRPADTEMWDEATRTFVARPAKVLIDRVQDLADDPVLSAVWSRLTAPQRTALRDRVAQLLARQRWRAQGEGVDFNG